MFAAHRIALDAPYDVVSTRLTHLVNWGVLQGVSQAAYEGGLETVLRVGPFGGTRGLSKLVRVHILDPVRREGKTTVSVRWEATGIAGDLFPVLDADIVLTPDGEDSSCLELVGSYRPPLGRTGEVLDRAVMGRVANLTIRSLLERAVVAIADTTTRTEADADPDRVLQWRPLADPEET